MRSFRRYLIFAVTLAVLTAGPSGYPTQHLVSPATTAIHATLTRAMLPAVTAQQLNAHLGVGVPSGWSPVDGGDVRLFVPSDWALLSHGSCIAVPSPAGMIGVGSLPNAGCGQSQFPIPAQAVALVPSSQRPNGPPALTIHGYGVYNVDSHTPGWVFFVVPQLGIRIATHGSMGSRILKTMAPSARTIALDPTYQSVPSNWHAVTKDGLTLSVPASWSIVTPTYLCGTPVGESELLLITPNVPYAPCAYVIPEASDAAHDAVALYLTPHNTRAPIATGQPITTLHHGGTTISVYSDTSDPNVLDLYVRKAGSKIMHVLTVGLGRDGRAAGGVLASIRAVT
jgi:hypothetical protein